MRHRILIALLLAGVAGFALATSAAAQTGGPSAGLREPEGGLGCFCVSEEGTDEPFCLSDEFCSSATPCASTADCGSGEVCWRGDNCCGFAICSTPCAGTCPGPPGTCGTYELCDAGVPTLGQWGMISLVALLAIGALLVYRRRGQFAYPTAFGLLVLALALGSLSYASIRETMDSCEPSEAELAVALFLDE